MKAFTDLYLSLDETTKTSAKVEALVNYFKLADVSELSHAVNLLIGKRPARPVTTKLLRQWSAESANIPDWLFDETYAIVGDLAETISLLSGASKAHEDISSLSETMNQLVALSKKTEAQKKEWLLNRWSLYPQPQCFVFNKLITGSFRVGVSRQLVYRALAQTFEVEENHVAHRLMGLSNLAKENIRALLLDASSSEHSRPYPFFLAYQLDVSGEELGPTEEWYFEKKYDGIRGQLVCRNQEINLWSRGEELLNDQFTEFSSLFQILPPGLVLDGELLPFKDGHLLSFAELQRRLGRKSPSKKMLTEVPLVMMCYDLLEWEGEDLRGKPIAYRRQHLEMLLAGINSPLLQLSTLLYPVDWKDADRLRNESRKEGCEGLMIKRRDSVYETGRRRGNWWKWKVEPMTVDAVLIYAQAGHGRRANLYTDYTFAIRDKGELVPFTKAYSGLTDAELKEADAWIKKNTLEKFGPVRSVRAELVFEIAFEGIQLSKRHKSGIALRFPRILRWRKDKTVEEINTREDLLQLLNLT